MAEPIAAETSAAACKKNDKPKPCCVCTAEKTTRDECLLINGQESGKCDDIISKYKSCMKGYGFTV